MTVDVPAGIGRAPASHDWIRCLTGPDAVPRLAAGRLRRVALVIGGPATQWGVAVGHRMAAHILDPPAARSGGRSDDELECLLRAAEASTLDTLVALHVGDHTRLARAPEPTENVAVAVSRGVALQDVLRDVHAAEAFLAQELVTAIESGVPAHERLAAVKLALRDFLPCWSHLAQHVTTLYARERERRTTSAHEARADAVRRVLAGRARGAPDATTVLDYPLDALHTALVLWLTGLDQDTARLVDLSALADEIAAACGSPVRPLAVGSRFGSVEVWLADCVRSPVSALRDHLRLPAPLRAAVGTTAAGPDGFRLSHSQAWAARRTARYAGRDEQVVNYADIEVVALLTTDVERARAFAHSTIGPLLRRDPKVGELRRTLMAWIDASGSVAGTAAALLTHRNTVTHRLRQIDELLGRHRDDTRVRCALEIVATMPDAVLGDR